MSMKQCRICKENFENNLENFYKHSSSSDGLYPYCKECQKKKSTKYQKDNPDKVKKYQKKDNEKRKEYIAVYGRLYRKNGGQTKWQRNNEDKIKEYRKKRKNKNHDISIVEWNECLEFFKHKCAYCGMSESEAKVKYNNRLHKEHVDHAGSNKIDNCVPACKSCNSSKGSRIFDVWYNENNDAFTQERYSRIAEWLGKFD